LKRVRRRPALVLVPLALLFVASGLVQAWRDSPTVDEAIDISAGVTSLVRHDLRLTPEHDVLVKLLPALPALAAHPVVPNGPAYQTNDWFQHTDDFIRANDAAGKLHLVVFLSRLVPLLEGLAIAGLLYLLGQRLFGTWAGVLSAGLWLTTPVFIGFSHVVGIDITFTLATLVVSLLFVRFLEEPSNRNALFLALSLGGALLARHTGLVLLATVLVTVLATGWRRHRDETLKHAGIVAFGSWAVVWLVIRIFDFTAPTGAAGARLDGLIAAGRHDSALTRIVLAVPWPKEWAAGFAYLVMTSTPKPAYLYGLAWNGGKWWYFLAAVPLKVPLVALVVLAVGLFGWHKVPAPKRRVAWLAVVAPAAVLYIVTALQPLDLGLRYVFPSLALWYVAAGPAVHVGTRRTRQIGAAALVVTQLAAVIAAYPHSISWTPPPFTPAYRWTTDSNVDYAQDNQLVDEWAAGKQPLVDLLLPRGFDIPEGSRPLLDVPPEEVRGWVAVSATRLTALDRDQLSWLRAYCPVGTIGGSVLIYRFEGGVDSRPGPTMPAGICSGDFSTRSD
jgi:hypothetical protein